ncbi:MAG TPA: hypothetical protein VF815_13960 [Myxococcaceae bacterium]
MTMRKWKRALVGALAAGAFLAAGPALAQDRGASPQRCEARCEDEAKRCREICEKYAGDDNDECRQACSEEQKRCTRECREQARR